MEPVLRLLGSRLEDEVGGWSRIYGAGDIDRYNDGWLTELQKLYFEITLSKAVASYEPDNLSIQERLMAVLKAFGSDTSKPKLLRIDAVPGTGDISDEELDSVFSPLLSDQSSCEAISVCCTGYGYGRYADLTVVTANAEGAVWTPSAVCTQIGFLLARSSTLETLIFYHPDSHFRTRAVEALTEGLVQTKCLRFLVLRRGLRGNWVDVLQGAFAGQVQNTSLESIELEVGMEGLDMALESLLSSTSKNLNEIRLTLSGKVVAQNTDSDYENTVYNFQKVAECLRRYKIPPFDTNRKVTLNFELTWWPEDAEARVFSRAQCRRLSRLWDIWLSANKCALMLETRLYIGHGGPWFTEGWPQLKKLHIDLDWGVSDSEDRFSSLCTSIHSIDSVEYIRVAVHSDRLNGTSFLSVDSWTSLFQSLHDKQRLKTLVLLDDGNWETDEVFRGLMDLLQVNIYLEDVQVRLGRWGEGRTELVQEALRRNKEQAAYFNLLHDAKLPFEEAKTARVFLCGQPHAGKTTLRVFMMEARGKESRLARNLKRIFGKIWKNKLKRTKGMDVELLIDDDRMQVSIWDLAGQDIFRALQSLLLPTVTRACVFVFVFSPYEDDHSRVKKNLDDAFSRELQSWLRFVASHYPIMGTFLPEVFVVITHKDKKEGSKEEWSFDPDHIVKNFSEQYKGALNLHAHARCMDATSTEECRKFLEQLSEHVSAMLKKRTPRAPSICSKLISQISNSQHDISKKMGAQPVWSLEDFSIEISKVLGSLAAGSFDQSVETKKGVLDAMIRYMHDVGSIVFLPNPQLVVGDLNWLTSTFLGDLINEGQNHSSEEGVVSWGQLKGTLSRHIKKWQEKEITVELGVLLQLLENLDLCYDMGVRDGVQKYFMPTIFGTRNARANSLTWGTKPPVSDSQCFGYRLLCENMETTSLTSAVFPRFQIYFRKEVDGAAVLQRDVIRHDRNGCFVIVENAEDGAHIDILVQFTKASKREESIVYVKEHILRRFREFCASPQGCRGVILVTAIIRPECVQRLTPQKYRKEQVILERQLQEHFRKDVEKKANLGVIMWPPGEKGGDLDLLSYEHVWPGVPEAHLYKASQQAIELLCESDVEEIMKAVRGRTRITAKELIKVEQQLDSHLKQSAGGGVCQQVPDQWRSEEEGSGGTSGGTEDDNQMLKAIIKHVSKEAEGIHGHIDIVAVSLSGQLRAIQSDISKLQKIQHSTLSSIMHKIDTMVGYSKALEDERLPRLPFITFTDVSVSEKVRSVMQVGTAVRLHLMCESRFRLHTIDDQPGLMITMVDENKEWLRRISVNSVKVLWVLVRLGVNVQLPGVAGLLPESIDLSSGLVPVDKMTLDKLKKTKLSSLPTVESSEVAKGVWKFLGETLLHKNIVDDFNLHLVRYEPGVVAVDQSYAWLCKKCANEGEETNVLKPFKMS